MGSVFRILKWVDKNFDGEMKIPSNSQCIGSNFSELDMMIHRIMGL